MNLFLTFGSKDVAKISFGFSSSAINYTLLCSRYKY
jgi:hypothetical protein